ncbi:hypothetical protein [Microbacterium sp. P04]|uniref:hypothetical protein n=1 Tax=Microbacterium sp. P04 TaxID=3366947 RepID=UPI003744CA9A
MTDDALALSARQRRKVARDIWIMIGTVLCVALTVVWAITSNDPGALIGLAVATVVVGAVKEVGKVTALRYEQAAAEARLSVEEPGGPVDKILLRFGISKPDDEAEKKAVASASLVRHFEQKEASASDFSAAAGLVVWVLGAGAVLTGALKIAGL